MATCPQNPRTTAHKGTQQEPPSPPNNENTAAEIEEQAMSLIGQMLRLMSYGVSLSTLLEQEQQSSLGTPVMEVHLSSALLAMVSLSMSTSDLLRTYIRTWKHLLPTTLSDGVESELLPECDALIEMILEVAHN